MSAAPRANRRAPRSCSRNGLDAHCWPSTGTTSECPDSSTPPRSDGPILAYRLALRPLLSMYRRVSTPRATRNSCAYSISARLESRLTVGKPISRSRIWTLFIRASYARCSPFLERITQGEADGTRLRYHGLRAIAVDCGIRIRADAEIVGQVMHVQRRQPVRSGVAQTRIEHGVTGHDRRARGQRRRQRALVMAADRIEQFAAGDGHVAVFQIDREAVLRRSGQRAAHRRWRRDHIGKCEQGIEFGQLGLIVSVVDLCAQMRR